MLTEALKISAGGLYLNLICYGILLVIILTYPLTKKIVNNYFFWLPICIIVLVYFICFRFWNDWENFSRLVNDENTQWGDQTSIFVSKALFMDLCPFVAVSLIISLMFDPSRKTSMIIAPFAIFGGIVTISGGILFDQSAELTFDYIFKGVHPNELYYIIHLFSILMGALVLLSTPRITWKGYLFCNLYAGLYYSYVGILIVTLNVTSNASGLVPYDWIYGEYSAVGEIFHLDYPWSMILGFSLSYLGICLIMVINDYGFKNMKWYKVPNIRNNLLNWYKI